MSNLIQEGLEQTSTVAPRKVPSAARAGLGDILVDPDGGLDPFSSSAEEALRARVTMTDIGISFQGQVLLSPRALGSMYRREFPKQSEILNDPKKTAKFDALEEAANSGALNNIPQLEGKVKDGVYTVKDGDEESMELLDYLQLTAPDVRIPVSINIGKSIRKDTVLPSHYATSDGEDIIMPPFEGLDNPVAPNPKIQPPQRIVLRPETIKHLKEMEGEDDKPPDGIYTAYLDIEKHPTGGVGHLLTPAEQELYPYGAVIPMDVVNRWLEEDTQIAWLAATKQAKELGSTDQDFIDALGEVNFQLGTDWTKEHVETWKLLKAGDWEAAAVEVADSLWNEQTRNRVVNFQDAIRELK